MLSYAATHDDGVIPVPGRTIRTLSNILNLSPGRRLDKERSVERKKMKMDRATGTPVLMIDCRY